MNRKLIMIASLAVFVSGCNGSSGSGTDLGAQIDGMGRPAINTALITTFASDAIRGGAEDTYNATSKSERSSFADTMGDQFAVYDSLVGTCSDNPLTNRTAANPADGVGVPPNPTDAVALPSSARERPGAHWQRKRARVRTVSMPNDRAVSVAGAGTRTTTRRPGRQPIAGSEPAPAARRETCARGGRWSPPLPRSQPARGERVCRRVPRGPGAAHRPSPARCWA